MKKKTVVGGRKVVPGPKQTEAQMGRSENVAAKVKFKTGPHAKEEKNK